MLFRILCGTYIVEVEQELQKHNFVKRYRSSYIQFGSGTCCPEEWMNFDASPILRLRRFPLIGSFLVQRFSPFPANVEFGDIVQGLPVPDGSAKAIYSCHVLEHLYKNEAETALHNIYNYLEPGGILRMVIPDISKLARAYLDDPDPEAGLRFVSSTHLTHNERPRGFLNFLRAYIGHSQHRWMWDYEGLKKELGKAGFRNIREALMGDSRLPEFALVEQESKFVGAFCVEAEK